MDKQRSARKEGRVMPIDYDYPDLEQILNKADYDGYYDVDPDERRANSANCGKYNDCEYVEE